MPFHPIYLRPSSCEIVISNTVGNSVGPDQMALSEVIYTGSTVLLRKDRSGFSMSSLQDLL